MGMVVRTNTMALNAYRQLGMNNSAVAKSLEKLSSGFRINRAGDDAAGLAISEKMKAQITGLETASANAQDGISLIQTAEGNLTEVHSMLNRMVELATKSANGTYTVTERRALQDEVDSLLDEIDRISKSANFNGTNLLDGSLAGINSAAFATTTVEAKDGATIDLAAKLPSEVAAGTTPVYGTHNYHLGKAGNEQTGPSFTIDLADLNLTAGTGGDATVSITVGGAALTSGNLGATAKSATQIRDAILADKANWTDKGKVAGNLKIGDFEFKVEADGTTGLKFTYAGLNASTTPAATDEFTTAQATAINTAIGSTVVATVTDSTGGGHTGEVQHNTMDVQWAEDKVTGSRAGIDLTLDATLVKAGNTLTIDGKTFTFVDADGKTLDELGENEIGIWSEDNAATQLAKAAEQLSNFDTDNFDIEAKTGGTIIHIDQKVGNTNVYDTYGKLKNLFSASGAGTKAGTQLAVTASAIKEGDVLNIGGKTYKFVEKASADAPKNITEVVMGKDGANAIDNLVTALKANGADATKSGTTITINGATITDGGLTLQIGDTADGFNKMNVAVKDMSAKGLDLDVLRSTGIMTEKDSSDAIQRIKDAINTVSSTRAGMGALQNRLEHTINNLDVAVENLSAANSRIRDTDMAKEMMNYTKMNVLVQSAQAMLAQANQQPQSVLQLLQ